MNILVFLQYSAKVYFYSFFPILCFYFHTLQHCTFRRSRYDKTQSTERHSTSPESLIHGRPKPAGCRRPRSVRLFVFLQHPEDLFASFACNWLFVKLTHDICHNHHNRLCKILLAQCKISQLEHKVKTQCKNLHIVLSRIYTLSSENFLSLASRLCKKK